MKGLVSIVLLALAAPAAAGAAPSGRLTLGSWNLEWLMQPATFDALAARCLGHGLRAGGSDRAIPCNIVPKARWSEQDLARLRSFAAALPLDVIALQEVDGAEAAAEVFPDHAFCFTKRKHVQNVGFAIRRGIPHRCNRDYRALGLAGVEQRVRFRPSSPARAAYRVWIPWAGTIAPPTKVVSPTINRCSKRWRAA